MLSHICGRISYLHQEHGETGREWFRITRNTDGTRTLRATCEMDTEGILRDLVYTIGADWKPLDSFVRLHSSGQFSGSSWFRFSDTSIVCEAELAEAGRISQIISTSERPHVFAAHALTCDGWQVSQFDHGRPGKRQPILSAHCSPQADGGSGPLGGVNPKELEYLGRAEKVVPAGTFDTEHYLIHTPREDWPPLELWVHGEDRILVQLDWPVLKSSYVLTELTSDISQRSGPRS